MLGCTLFPAQVPHGFHGATQSRATSKKNRPATRNKLVWLKRTGNVSHLHLGEFSCSRIKYQDSDSFLIGQIRGLGYANRGSD